MRSVKGKQEAWHDDVEDLLQQAVVEEAVQAVTQQLEAALAALDQESLVLFRKFLDGTSIAKLAAERNLSVPEVERWIAKVKLTVAQSLREKCMVKQ